MTTHLYNKKIWCQPIRNKGIEWLYRCCWNFSGSTFSLMIIIRNELIPEFKNLDTAVCISYRANTLLKKKKKKKKSESHYSPSR